MVRVVEVSKPCGLSADKFWALRSDTRFDDWFCRRDKQIFDLEKNERSVAADGVASIDRAFRMYMQEDQVPKALKTVVPKDAANKFYVKVVASFSPDRFDEQRPYWCAHGQTRTAAFCFGKEALPSPLHAHAHAARPLPARTVPLRRARPGVRR